MLDVECSGFKFLKTNIEQPTFNVQLRMQEKRTTKTLRHEEEEKEEKVQ